MKIAYKMRVSAVYAADESYPLKGASMTPSEDYRLIPLTQGQFAKVSLRCYEDVVRFKWHAYWSPGTRSFYARRTVNYFACGRRTADMVLMHRYILGLEKGDGRSGDHENHDTLDNRDSNLRIASPTEQSRNRRIPKNNTSGFKGVQRYPDGWRFRIFADGKRFCSKAYATPTDAFTARCAMLVAAHGEFARVK